MRRVWAARGSRNRTRTGRNLTWRGAHAVSWLFCCAAPTPTPDTLRSRCVLRPWGGCAWRIISYVALDSFVENFCDISHAINNLTSTDLVSGWCGSPHGRYGLADGSVEEQPDVRCDLSCVKLDWVEVLVLRQVARNKNLTCAAIVSGGGYHRERAVFWYTVLCMAARCVSGSFLHRTWCMSGTRSQTLFTTSTATRPAPSSPGGRDHLRVVDPPEQAKNGSRIRSERFVGVFSWT